MTAHDQTDDQALALKLWVVLSRAHAAIEAHAVAQVARHGLTLTEFGIMEALFHRGPMLLGEVQRRILVSSGGITYLVDRLERKGLVERRECAEDRRARYAALTERGETVIREIFPEHAQHLEHALGGLDAAEKEQAIRLLRTLGTHAAKEKPLGADGE
ncbi:MAG TPA: MarR family transcriptional regulator [Longimicrobiaceae bacterium]|nr:MarR family transcriptional regulator [Longimicrobiaceae bacterium]